MKDIKDVTSESFGLLIAYLLPGLMGLFGIAMWSATLRRLLATFLTEQSNFNLLGSVLV